jgi:pantoate--beta-alanine ligase
MYRTPPTTRIDVGRLGNHLCGKHRPGHFDGVGLVVLKLFNLVQPDVAYFGEKDAQQLAIIRRLVSDLSVPVGIAGVSTVRDPDGLALSSRNQHLSPAERTLATALPEALEAARRAITGGTTDVAAIVTEGLRRVPQVAELRVEYLEVVDPVELQPVDFVSGTVLVAGALWVGTTRLIDNVLCEPAGDTP